MPRYLLIAPTGTGKSSVRERNPKFKAISTDGDSLVDWAQCQDVVDWTGPDRKHLDYILLHMRSENKCVCWYVGTTAIADALDEGRLNVEELLIVLIPEDVHRQRVSEHNKEGHGWTRAEEHRALCKALIEKYHPRVFTSVTKAVNFLLSESAKCNFSEIDKHYKIHAETLGAPVHEERRCSDGVGRYRTYEKGSIHYHPDTGAHETHGAIRDAWARENWETGWLGYPTSDEKDLNIMEFVHICDDGAISFPDIGRVSYFQNGVICRITDPDFRCFGESDGCAIRQYPSTPPTCHSEACIASWPTPKRKKPWWQLF